MMIEKFYFLCSSGSYLMDLVTKCGIDLSLGIVQTAYANGGSTDYIEKELVSILRQICLAKGTKDGDHFERIDSE